MAGFVFLAPVKVMAASLEKELADFIYLYPLVKAGKASVQSAEQGIRQSKAGYLPIQAPNTLTTPPPGRLKKTGSGPCKR